jgi:hypothetical protein
MVIYNPEYSCIHDVSDWVQRSYYFSTESLSSIHRTESPMIGLFLDCGHLGFSFEQSINNEYYRVYLYSRPFQQLTFEDFHCSDNYSTLCNLRHEAVFTSNRLASQLQLFNAVLLFKGQLAVKDLNTALLIKQCLHARYRDL